MVKTGADAWPRNGPAGGPGTPTVLAVGDQPMGALVEYYWSTLKKDGKSTGK
jgi:hypothetical protein